MTSRVIGYLTIDQKGRTTLPQRVREQLGLVDGTQLRIEQTESGAFEIVPSISIPQDQLWYHSPAGRAMFAEAEADFRAGRVTRTKGEAETRRFLDSLKKSASPKRNRKNSAPKPPKRSGKR